MVLLLISLLQLHAAVFFNHDCYTLLDPLDVHDCLEQLGFAFEEISRREIKLILSDAAVTRYFCPDCFGILNEQQNEALPGEKRKMVEITHQDP